MRKSFLFLISILVFSCQPNILESKFLELSEYNGIYEYSNSTEIHINVSSKDTILYAILDEVNYPLKRISKDSFIDVAGNDVLFVRDKDHEVIGYHLSDTPNKSIFKVIEKGTKFSDNYWFPRKSLVGKKYTYQKPTAQKDGIEIGLLSETPLNKKKLEAMVNDIVSEKYKNIHSILIIYKNKLVFEEYFYDYNVDRPHQMRSATKSYISTLMGIAIDKKLIKDEHQKVLPFFKNTDLENPSVQKNKITIEHLLTQTSGLECNDWDPLSKGNESILYKTDDWTNSLLNLPQIENPGKKPRYCSVGVLTLGEIIEKATYKDLPSFANKYLFDKLDFGEHQWPFILNKTNANTFAQLYLRPRDQAKFMMMIANNGQWNGQQIVSENWIKKAISTHVMLDHTDYGYLWWKPYLNVKGKKYNAILATGNGGQKAYIWKDLDLVTIFNGGNYNQDSKVKELLVKYIL